MRVEGEAAASVAFGEAEHAERLQAQLHPSSTRQPTLWLCSLSAAALALAATSGRQGSVREDKELSAARAASDHQACHSG